MAEDLIRERFGESIAVKNALRGDEHVAATRQMTDIMVEALRADRKVMFCGNGGSAADSMHLAAELVGRFRFDRPALPGLSLSDSQSVLTCIGNDYAFDQVFSRGVHAFGREGDVLVGISTSGTSPNVIAAMQAAREKGLRRVGMTGARGAALAELCEVCLMVPSEETARIQEGYMLVAHTVCELVEQALFG